MGLRAEGLTKQYGPFTALSDVTVTVEDGERVALLGPNGSGKTTMLRLLAGLLTPTSGRVAVDGEPYRPDAYRLRRKVGFVSHDTMLYENLTARENLAFHAQLRGVPDERVDEVLEVVDLAHRASGLPREFSHGMRKRLSLARAEIDPPDILLLDEPFSGLDQFSTATVKELLRDRTVLLVTHEFDVALDVCDRAIVLRDGEVGVDLQGDSLPETLEAFRETYREVVR
ncbi:MAG: ABC transporter ATP-binding protein [Halodesulfurarchaeum sp.]